MGIENISSTALKRNLKLTKKGSQELPREYQWLLDKSAGKKGINERCSTLLEEYYHKYSNHKIVTEDLVQVSLSDMWFYNQLEEREQAFSLILTIFSDLLQQEMETGVQDRLVQTLIKFVGKLAEQEDRCLPAIEEGFQIIRRLHKIEPYILERNSTYIKNHFGVIYEIDKIRVECLHFCRKLFEGVYNRWYNLPV